MMVGTPYVNGVSYPQIKKLLHESLHSLDNEFRQLFQKAEWAEQYLFEYNERVLVGLFNNALIRRNDEYCTFQEYHVYRGDEQLVGRADLLIVHKEFDFLIEAKNWVYDGSEYKDISGLIVQPKEQVLTYYEAEKKYFKEGQTFLGVLIFEYVAKKYLKEVKKQYTEPSKPEKGIHFDAFYVSANNGLMVYGQVFPPSGGTK